MSVASMTASSRLASIVGPAHVFRDSAELAAYDICGMVPAVIVQPGSSAEVAEIVKFAVAEKLALVPMGARTKLVMGLPPRQYDLALDMTRLNRVVAYDPGDLTLSVESGIRLRNLASVLAAHRQFLPLEVPFASQATAGGAIASGVDTALRQMYGAARDYVLGMEFVTGQGLLAKSGGRVVKNVTGYDIHKLMIGALGTLGVITKINFRTFPVPASARAFAAEFENAEGALEWRHRIARSSFRPLSLEVLSPGAAGILSGEAAARAVPDPIPSGLFSNRRWTFLAAFSGNGHVLERCERDLREMAEQCNTIRFSVLGNDEIAGASNRVREFIPLALRSSPAATVVKIAVLPTRLSEALAAAAKSSENNSLPWAAMARGLGVIYFALLPNVRSNETRRLVIQATDQILSKCSSLGGSAVVPWCPVEWKSNLKVWGLGRGDLDQMRKLKMVFDPHGVLSPGRFVGGI
ncbi:MAG TPA: FAD-binding oxidoreductase [Candidatus Acidoferrales bacterium]|nr:FAD-binding oxidoreductase [Candidatus Acidoferrales bacterium]